MFLGHSPPPYVHAHTHQGSNPKPHGDSPKSKSPNHFKTLITSKKKFKFIGLGYQGKDILCLDSLYSIKAKGILALR